MLYVRKNIFDRERFIIYSDKEYDEGTVIQVKGNATGFAMPPIPECLIQGCIIIP